MAEFLKKLKKKISLGKLFHNNKFVLFFSLVCSFTFWIIFSSSSAESVPVTISDIPIEINLSDEAVASGLRIFSGQGITAKVEVMGSRMVVGQLTKNDIQIVASQTANTIMSPGNYTLELVAKKVGILKDYSFVSDVKPSVITVMVDRYREAEFKVESDIDFNAQDGYFVGNTALSNPEITVSGPETEVSKIKKVMVKGQVHGIVNNSINLKLPIVMYDAYDQPINSTTIKTNVSEIEVNIPILVKKTVKLEPSFKNMPSGVDISLKEYSGFVNVNPSKIEIVGPENVISEIENIKLPEVDFKTISPQKNKFQLQIQLPTSCKTLDNSYTANLEIDTSLLKEKTLNINNFSFVNVPEGKTPKVYGENVNVSFIGFAKSINILKSSNITAQIDFNGKENESNLVEVPLKLKVEGFNDVWNYKEYFVNVSLLNSKK